MRISDWSSDVCSSDLSTTTGIAIDLQDLTARMPLGRSLTDAALLAPTATAGDTTFGNLASLGGASVAENAYYINGLNITNFDHYLGSAPYRKSVVEGKWMAVRADSGGRGDVQKKKLAT